MNSLQAHQGFLSLVLLAGFAVLLWFVRGIVLAFLVISLSLYAGVMDADKRWSVYWQSKRLGPNLLEPADADTHPQLGNHWLLVRNLKGREVHDWQALKTLLRRRFPDAPRRHALVEQLTEVPCRLCAGKAEGCAACGETGMVKVQKP